MKKILIIMLILIFQSCVIVRSSMTDRIQDWEKYKFNKVRNYNEIIDYITTKTEHNIIGTVDNYYGSYDIYEIVINNNADKDILIFGGIHGDEIAGITSCLEFIEQFKDRSFSKDYNYIIVPIVNPWGYEYNIRYNGEGIDLNRDFAPGKFNSQEAEIIYNAYHLLDPYIVIDNHEDNFQSKNYFFIYDNYLKPIMKNFISSEPDFNYDNESTYSIYKTKKGINKIDKNILWLVEMSDRITLSNYFLKKTSNVIVIESGSLDVNIKVRNEFHLRSMKFILENL